MASGDLTDRARAFAITEARRAAAEERLTPDPARVAEGWERRFIAEGARSEEMIALYQELGYEVCADPLSPDQMEGECEDCRLLMLLHFKMIYTRRRARR